MRRDTPVVAGADPHRIADLREITGVRATSEASISSTENLGITFVRTRAPRKYGAVRTQICVGHGPDSWPGTGDLTVGKCLRKDAHAENEAKKRLHRPGPASNHNA